MDKVRLHIGIDNVDSPLGGCTTHFAYKFIKYLLTKYREDVALLDYPNLVRLNPAIPYKTRGNGAVVIRLLSKPTIVKSIIKDLVSMLNEYLHKYSIVSVDEAETGVAIVKGDVDEVLRNLYIKALTDYVPLTYISELINEELKDKVTLPLGLKRGVIGALSSIGGLMSGDCTYELIVYRERPGNPTRCVDEESVKIMDRKFREWVFSNYDYDEDRILITPHGPDPVLIGIRGEDPRKLVEALSYVKICESIEGWMIFRTNQGTDAHHVMRRIGDVRPFQTGCIEAYVISNPKILRGGDVILEIGNSEGKLHAVFFRETSLTNVARELITGDSVTLCGVFKYWEEYGTVLHVEKLTIENAVNEIIKRNPKCPRCGARMKSAGRGKGWKCPKCGYRTFNAEYEVTIIKRKHLEGHYTPKESAIKHLVKPKRRYGRERECKPKEPKTPWIN